jgi:hypothetical protein
MFQINLRINPRCAFIEWESTVDIGAGKGGQTSTLWIVGRKSKLKKKGVY